MGPILLFLTTFIWGTAFLAQKIGAQDLGPFTLTCLRNILGGAFLFACILVRDRRGGRRERRQDGMKGSVRAGVICGVPLFLAMLAQQIGIQYTKPGISAFLTTNYVLFVPLIVAALTRRLPRKCVIAGAVASLAGTYLICLPGEGMSVGRGELWTILCAFLFAVQMVAVDRYARDCDVLVMSCSQLVSSFVLGLPFLLLPSEFAQLTNVFSLRGILSLVYLGVFSSGIAYTLQNFGQAKTAPGPAAVILSMESVFGALSGYVVLGDVLTPLQFSGCALVFAAAVGTQLAAQRGQSPVP